MTPLSGHTAILQARDLWGPDAFAALGRDGVKSVGYYVANSDDHMTPVVLGRGRTWEAAFKEAEGKT